jgi:hypothetical protein
VWGPDGYGRYTARPRSARRRPGEECVKVPAQTRWCQGRRPRRASGTSVSGGRGAPENVTCGRSRSANAGPMPRTPSSASIDPNGPSRARSSTIRAASAGPIPGSRSSSSTVARSTSIGSVGGAALAVGAGRGAGEVRVRCTAGGSPVRPADESTCPGARLTGLPVLDRRGPPLAIKESTWASWSASAELAAGTAGWRSIARHARTPAPSAATAATKIRAWRSAGVGTRQRCLAPAGWRHRSAAIRMKGARGCTKR